MPDAWRAKPLYEQLYCARGEMETGTLPSPPTSRKLREKADKRCRVRASAQHDLAVRVDRCERNPLHRTTVASQLDSPTLGPFQTKMRLCSKAIRRICLASIACPGSTRSVDKNSA